MADKMISILYIDDEMNNLQSFKATFRLKYTVHIAISGEEAKKILDSNPTIEIIITDQRMPNMTGVEFLESIIDTHPDPIRVLLTGYADLNAVIDAVNKGKIFHYMSKPWNEEELTKTIEVAHELYEKRESQKEYTDKVVLVNSQLEFLLRQKLLS
jgi:response regulator RpfG family c-di-GMP phosphodiesterase